MRRVYGLAVAAGLLALTAGCGPKDGTVEVSGTVTFNGKPVDDGSIQFAGQGDDAATVLITNGRYTAKLTKGQKKVVVEGLRKTGTEYRDPADKTTAYDRLENYLPTEYNRGTKLTADITGSTDKQDFALTGKDQLEGKVRR